jgi:hypothetical protein
VFTNSTAPLVEAEATHRGHTIVEQVIADLKNPAPAHQPSGTFAANTGLHPARPPHRRIEASVG